LLAVVDDVEPGGELAIDARADCVAAHLLEAGRVDGLALLALNQ
jgi:hypothetical protein